MKGYTSKSIWKRFFSFFSYLFGDIFSSFVYHPSSVVLETILRVYGFPSVSVLGSYCFGVGLCQLLSSMLINVIISSYIQLHFTAFAEIFSAVFHLMPSPAFTTVMSYLCAAWIVFLLLFRGQHRASTYVTVSGHPWSLHKKWPPRLGMPGLP